MDDEPSINGYKVIRARQSLKSEAVSVDGSTLHDDEDDDSTSVEELIRLGEAEFESYFDFPLDDWQLQAGGAICKGYNVIVTAPTGAGKTVVGEMALLHSFHVLNKHGIYTTPLKALSNQKYSDLSQMFGRQNTGLSTGDISINKEAQIKVMTTEVYRNIAWRSSTPAATAMGTEELSENAVVVLDEFHYMGNPGRGGVWEESVITSPNHTQIVGLSATLANGDALASWMEHVTGRKTMLVEVPGQKRPVPLRYLFATKRGLFPLFRDPDAGPGAPNGLLGYRGDGEPQPQKGMKKQKKNGFGDENEGKQGENSKKIPRGLTVHPTLLSSAQARMQKVVRIMERRKRQDLSRKGGDDISFNVKRGRGMSPRQEQKEKERLLKSEMRREVPSLGALLTRLKQKSLLPAIFFIFSRAACDEQAASAYQTMKGPRDPNRILDDEFEQFDVEPDLKMKRKQRKTRQRTQRKAELLADKNGRTFRPESNFVSEEVLTSYLDDSAVSIDEETFDETSPLAPENWDYYSKAGLLGYKEVREVASRIEVFNEQNPEIAFEDELCEQFLFGVGSHHAGMLPAHKSFVEILFRRQLMAVVFATETLAAGINMPARTTVVCAMAKRTGSGSSMSLLETSNLLQMAGRAGRRGFDTEGTCVLVATPFESHDDAVKILTDPIKPIQSQFTPSYSLAANLVVRGEGKLEVARQLVSKSFAAWERRRAEDAVSSKMETHGEGVSEILQMSAQERFMNTLMDTLQFQVDERRARFDIAKIQFFLDILNNRESLKTASKSYISLAKVLELEEVTLQYLMKEADGLTDAINDEEGISHEDLDALAKEDANDLIHQISEQKKRTVEAQKTLQKNPFTGISKIAQSIIDTDLPEGCVLKAHLQSARGGDSTDSPLAPSELTEYAKSAIVANRKTRKLLKDSPGLDTESLLIQAEKVQAIEDGSWDEVLAIVKTLVAYGCLTIEESDNDSSDDGDMEYETATYSLTPAGMNVGMLGFENSLWTAVAMGAAWDVRGDSSAVDSFQQEMDLFDNDDESSDADNDEQVLPKAAEEAKALVSMLCNMDVAEFAGYVSAIITENSRGGAGQEVLDTFRQLTPTQQRVIQSALTSMDRLMEVQRLHSVDSSTRSCNFDISSVEVVTQWAGGCSWNDALQISGLPPGDLVRTLSRVLDAVRQLGNLPYEAIRGNDWILGSGGDELVDTTISPGIHPEVRRLCREAAKAINRYPVKDPLAFETPIEEDDDDEEDDEDEGLDSQTEVIGEDSGDNIPGKNEEDDAVERAT
eukprot:CAMPEP_0172448424 /NCGR_PEP_ID=MMETSP1065-20121228/7441_1 /TAXON_ID=265537 /ORGANISM="Amphiprora paludosa, Strain CCMP125" /LENGTH=1279 /DNA_ID=CAMNT_0013199913 /DNA_START=179 /DNA_END=4019 /DNA_ORIENTATION=-